MRRLFVIYLLIVVTSVAATLLALRLGKQKYDHNEVTPSAVTRSTTETAVSPPKAPQSEQITWHPLSILLLQIIVVLLATRLLGSVFRKLRQPAVMGEMVAGILLGPSVAGWLWPGAMAFLFPPSGIEPLRLFGQVGVILFMFTVGIELDWNHLRSRAHAIILVSHTSIVIPFFSGVALCLLIFPHFVSSQVSFVAFALFIGVAMSITAFPVLARIIEERGLSGSILGRFALACAAIDDATAWCLLAGIIAIVRADGFGSTMLTIGALLVYAGVMLAIVRPQVSKFAFDGLKDRRRGKLILAGLLLFLFASALTTESIGIHALFGAFIAGVVMPSNANLRTFVVERIEVITEPFLLPLFFAFTGLRTQIGLLNDKASWIACGAVIAVAIAGKLGGSAIAARVTGMDWHNSLSLGVLMNTRGLIELIVLNIGYDLGILSPRAFSMMVLMALVTTFMAGPLLSLLGMAKSGALKPGTLELANEDGLQ